MKAIIARKFIILILPLVLAAALFQTQAALADLGVIGVQPATVSNTTTVELVVTGSDFVDGAVVIIEGVGALETDFISDTVLRATLPAGVSAGIYSITVVNPDSTSVTIDDALTVIEPQEPTPTSTSQPGGSSRPLLVIDSYGTDVQKIQPGTAFKLNIKLENVGAEDAKNVVAVFTPGDFVPRDSGGVVALSEIDSDESRKIVQPLTASADLSGKKLATLVMQVNYTGTDGAAYSETFNITLPVIAPVYGPGPTATPTPTPTSAAAIRPQLVITGYDTDVQILQPGNRFTLGMQIQNLGNTNAKRVSMILGGGGGSSGSDNGTPTVGGVSGGSGDFGNFAPVAASNVQFLGDIETGANVQASATLIVNAATNPGAYPMKISFTYVDEKGRLFNDDQVITLLVYALPVLDVNFYRQPDPFFTGQPGIIPLQVVNLGRKVTVLGNMKVSTQGGQLSNNTILVGALDVGGYYTLDATIIPDFPGMVELQVTIDYTDDFNQPQVISRTVTIEVLEAAPIEPPPGEGEIPGEGEVPVTPGGPETFWQKAFRFLKGLLGLDSGLPTPSAVPPGEIPPGEIPPGEEIPPGQPIPLNGPKG